MSVTELAERILTALQADDVEQLLGIVSNVDWQQVSQEETNDVLQKIGMYGYSGRTQRFSVAVNRILDSTDTVNLCSAALLNLNELAAQIAERDPSQCTSRNSRGETPLHCAAERGNLVLARKLCDRGVDVNAKSNAGQTPLHHAMHAGPWKSQPAYEIVSLLRSHNAEIDFHTMAVLGDVEGVQKYLEVNRASIDEWDASGRTALFHASRNNHVTTVDLLLEEGADPNVSCEDAQTPLSTACLHMLSQECDQVIVENLLAHGATPTVESAIVTTNLAAIREMIEKQPALLEGQDHESALGYSIQVWRPDSLKLLLELGARPDSTNWQHVERIAKGNTDLVSELRSLADDSS